MVPSGLTVPHAAQMASVCTRCATAPGPWLLIIRHPPLKLPYCPAYPDNTLDIFGIVSVFSQIFHLKF
jgi:hypothetical protein